MEVIDAFRDEFRFLSNFYLCSVLLHDVWFPSSEHAYQACKTANHDVKIYISKIKGPKTAKQYGQTISLPRHWKTIRVSVMETVVREKFLQNVTLKHALLKTGDATLIEGNTWGDTFWGVCRGVGENHLGQILMQVRSQLKPAELPER